MARSRLRSTVQTVNARSGVEAAEGLCVPGPVAVPDASGAITSMDPREIDDPVVVVPQITWEMFVDFLNAGQWYE